jgi:hypothetical protein
MACRDKEPAAVTREKILGEVSRRIFEGENGDLSGKDAISGGQHSETKNLILVLTRTKRIQSKMNSSKETMR